MQISLVVEGDADAAVAERLVDFAGHDVGPIHGRRGKGWIDERITSYNRAAVHGAWFVVRDLDRSPCPGGLVAQLLPERSPRLALRIAVRAIESWLLADREKVSEFLQVAVSVIPRDPESLAQPKAEVVNLARRSRARAIREDLVPAPGHTSQVGPAYNARIIEFVRNHWRPSVARLASDSLERCLSALKRLT